MKIINHQKNKKREGPLCFVVTNKFLTLPTKNIYINISLYIYIENINIAGSTLKNLIEKIT